MVRRSNKLKKINPNEYGGLLYDHQELDAILHVLFNGKIFRYASKRINPANEFEANVRKMLNVPYAIGLNNGTSALKTALHAIGIKPGDRVLISAYTFIATAAAVISMGGVPIPIDFDFEYGMNLDDLDAEMRKGCGAIIPVHIQGRAFNIGKIMALARKKKVAVIEDACQAFGSKYNSQYAGCMGDIGVYSFQQYKQISAGEGGLMVTNNPLYYKRAVIYSDHGWIRERMSWESVEATIGDNYRLSNLHAAILNIQILKMKKLLEIQKRNNKYIMQRIAKLHLESLSKSPDTNSDTGMNIMLYADSKENADRIIAHAKENNIEIRRLWNKPYYKHSVIGRLNLIPESLGKSNCTLAEEVADKLLSISVPPTLSINQLNKLSLEIKRLYRLGLIS